MFEIQHEEGRYTPTNGYEYFHKDHLGNVRLAYKQGTNGAPEITQYTDYDPWGLPLWAGLTGGTSTNRNQFLNREYEAETGFVDLKNRQYDWQIGRFTSVDPVTDGQESFSTYHYSYNDPVNKSDPDGLCPTCPPSEGEISAFGGVSAKSFETFASKVLEFTDINDITVLVTSLTRSGNAINIGGSPATTGDKIASAAGLFLPIVAGSTIKKVGEAVVDKAIDLIQGANKGNDAAKGVVDATKSTSRAGKPFTPAEKAKVIDENASKNSGKVICANCGVETTTPAKSTRGVTPPKTDRQIDHIVPKSKGGSGTANNGQVLCRDCNRAKSDN